jgi:methionyl-tRNA formyltransferase
MQMDAGLDTGDILFQESVPIGPQETGESLYDRLAQLGGEMIVKYLPAIEAGDIHPVPQQDSLSTYAPMLKKEMGEIDWTMPAGQIEQRMRGMLPWPGAYTTLGGHILKIWRARVQTDAQVPAGTSPGTVLYTDKKTICVAAGQGALELLEVQAEGKKRMETDAFLRGTKVSAGDVLGRG